MTRVTEFLTKHNQASEQIIPDKLIAEMTSEMNKGLDQGSSLPMIPTYLCLSNNTSTDKKIIIDAGGTNFRSAVGYFDDNGRPIIEDMSSSAMPGVAHAISAEKFFAEVANRVSHLTDKCGDVGFCFSYAVDMNKDIDGAILTVSKEVKINDAVGLLVGENTLQAISQYDNRQRDIVILNDTVATLLGGYANRQKDYCSYIGYIYGTGTNVCYLEKTNNITKVQDYDQEDMIINVEVAHFDKFTLGDYDKLSMTNTVAGQQLEKVTSGRYLAEVIRQCYLGAETEQLFVEPCDIQEFQLKDISMFLEGENNCIYDMFRCTEDRTTAKEIAREMIDRSAKLGAIVNSALVMRVGKRGETVAIVCEGSTFDKLTGYKANFVKYLDQLLGEHKISYEILQGDNLNMIGTLMATMVLQDKEHRVD